MARNMDECRIWEGVRQEKRLGGDEVRTVRESSFILGGQAGGVYNTAYQEAIPETAKLTRSGNSQILVLLVKN